jgi:outer membrane protein assembly factor BamB
MSWLFHRRTLLTALLCGAFSLPSGFAQEGEPEEAAAQVPLLNPLAHKWEPPSDQAVNREQFLKLNRAMQLIRRSEPADVPWADVLEPLQSVLDSAAGDSYLQLGQPDVGGLTPVRPRRVTTPLFSMKHVVEQLIRSLPPEGRRAYEQFYGTAAKTLLKEALRSGTLDDLRIVSQRYFQTAAGNEAALRLGIAALDQQKPFTALQSFERLRRESPRRAQWEPLLTLNTTAAWIAVGRDDQARQTATELRSFLAKNPQLRARLPEFAKLPDAEFYAKLRETVPDSLLTTVGPRDWTHFLATSSRSGLADRVNPVAVSLWESSTTGFDEKPSPEQLDEYSPLQIERDQDFTIPETRTQMAAAIKADLAFLNAEAEQLHNWPIPAMHPLVTKDRVLFRTQSRVRCVDIATGQVAWETFTDDPAFADLFDLDASQALSIRLPREPIWSPMNRFQHALIKQRTQVDRTSGTLTTDGERVYFVTESGVPDRMIALAQRESVRASPLRWNTLCAADLETGEVVWELGGPHGERELAFGGSFFLGAPISVDGVLYGLAEEDASVRLVCLDPATGERKWWQTIARPIASVEHEAIRRVGGDSPTLAEGLLICPTSSGLVAAYDPKMRRFVWTHRYDSSVPQPTQSSRIAMGIPISINMSLVESSDRWQESCVLSGNGRVVLSPLDSGELICLDLLTGNVLWKQPRGAGLFVACLSEKHVVVVEPEGVRGILLENGKTDWFTALEGRGPTGRGVHDGEKYHLPVLVRTGESPAHALIASPSRGAILTIELATGRILAGTTVAKGQRIGNLAAAHGVLVSQQAGSVLAFESFDAVGFRIATRLKENPDDGSALAMRGRMRLHHGRTTDGLNDLARAIQLEAGTEVQQDYVEAVLEELRNGRIDSDKALARLSDVPLGSKYQLVLDRVHAESMERDGRLVAAFDAYLALARRVERQKSQETHMTDGVTLGLRRWIGSRLAALHSRASTTPELLAEMEERIAAAALFEPGSVAEPEDPAKPDDVNVNSESGGHGAAALRFWLELFAWHESADRIRMELASLLDPDTDFLELEQVLARASSGGGEFEWQSMNRLLNHWARPPNAGAALAALPNFEARFGARAVSHAAGLRERKALRDVAGRTHWPDSEPVTNAAPKFSRHFERFPVPVIGDRSPAIDGWTFEVNLTLGMLVGKDSLGRDRWGVRLAEEGGRLNGVHPGTLSLLSSGHTIAVGVGNQFVVFDISGPTPTELWRESFSSGEHHPVFLMTQRSRLGVFRLNDGNGRSIGSLDLVTSEYVIYRKRSSMIVSRLRSGEVVWQRTSVDPNATLIGDDRRIVLLQEGNESAEVFRLYDGRSITTTRFPAGATARLVASFGSDPVMWVSQNFARFLVRFDSLTGEAVWTHEYSNNSLFRPVENRLVAIGEPDGTFHFRDVATGEAVIDTKSEPFQNLVAMHILPIRDGFVVFKATAPKDPQIFPAPLSALGSAQHRIGGSAFAVSSSTGNILWSREMPNLLLSLDQSRDLPVFVLACERRRITPTQFGTEGFLIAVLDSRSGKTLFEQTLTQSTRAYRTSVAPDGHEIDIAFDRMTVTLNYAAPE